MSEPTTIPLVPEREQEIRHRAAAATPGPWHLEHSPDSYGCVTIGDYGWVAPGPGTPEYDVDSDQGRSDAEFIAHARGDVPALLAEIERLRGEMGKWRDQRNGVFQENLRLVEQVDEARKARLRAENDARKISSELNRLRAELEAVQDTGPYGREMSTGQPCPDHPRPGVKARAEQHVVVQRSEVTLPEGGEGQ